MATLTPQQITTLIGRLNQKHPDARYELDWETPLQLLVGTILAAQCTDERVNKVTPALFKKYPSTKAFAEADRGELEVLLKQTGFYRQKAKTVQEVCRALMANHDGEVPKTMEDLVALPGVARKSANVVLNNAFRIPSGIIVDTHVNRVAPRMGLSKQTKPEKIEKDLMQLIPQEEWCQFGPALVLHGRYTCTHSEPNCGGCVFNDFCPRIGVEGPAPTPIPAPTPEVVPVVKNAMVWDGLPADWAAAVEERPGAEFFTPVDAFVTAEREKHTVFPPADDVFNAFRYTPFDKVRVVLLGQDPYHDDGQAHGLAFSVRPGVKPPPSLVNMYKELKTDVKMATPDHGCLIPWAKQGVLLLNTSLTVRAHEPASHSNQGWEDFTDAVIRALSARERPIVFLLWGGHAQKKAGLINGKRHHILKMAHPSPLSAKKFLGSKPFSQVNTLLKKSNQEPIDWSLPKLGKKSPDEVFGTLEPVAPTPTPTAAPVVAVVPETAPTPQAADGAGTALDLVLKAAVLRTVGPLIPADWRAELNSALQEPTFLALQTFLEQDAVKNPALPAPGSVYLPLHETPFRSVRVVLLGEEPEGPCPLAWSAGAELPPNAVVEAFSDELCDDLGCWPSVTGDLSAWADRGVLLWNAVPTRRESKPGSHAKKGWEEFTRALLLALCRRPDPVVFALLGPKLAAFQRMLSDGPHEVILAPHPTAPDFAGCKLFSRINAVLEQHGESGVWWQLRSF